MADIVPFPSEAAVDAVADDEVSRDVFFLNEGLDLLADYRAIDDQLVRDSIRQLVKSLSLSSRRSAGSK